MLFVAKLGGKTTACRPQGRDLSVQFQAVYPTSGQECPERSTHPPPPHPQVGGIGGSDGVKPPTEPSWRPLVGDPLPSGVLLSLRLSRGPARPSVVTPIFDRRLLAAETSFPEGTN